MTRHSFHVYGTAASPLPDEDEPFSRIGALARRAENHGMDGLLVFYNHRNLDPWAVAGAILQQTRNVKPLVALQPYSLPPFTAAKLLQSMTLLYGRRIDINLITGAAKEELEQVSESALDHDARYERAVEYMRVVRALLSSDEPLVHEGRHYRYRSLDAHAYLPPGRRPKVFVAGSSPAASRAADAVGDIAVTHPEPVEQFAETFAAGGAEAPEKAVRVGLIARATREEAWSAARALYPADRRSLLKTAVRRRSESDWSRRLAVLAHEQETYDDVYWTGAYRADKGSTPLLVGSHGQVADYLGRYLALGVSTVLLGGMATEEDHHHTALVLSDLRSRT